VKEVSVIPMQIGRLYRPEPLKNGDPRFHDNLRFLEWSSEGFDTRFTVRGDEVVLTQGGQREV
jgi:hypothetical protein